ncbi:D-TA family PLP-dependent enzyme [Dyadobacter frigoris]|uniref:D-TA family PLP-dependent enzyme n=1 Tax=Dyadobacter frigoris TaxID=2576211 RepID=A0A4U6CVP3_9BACT|nr:D-TA family PLP-dependent enzyme [Dyadobacter frigoris]TKT88839.1 D-TA family PLP-dependent enzyme [Dyadobacter frigoris]GLU56027.1 threonine aldolase [Dyadobacter frigoris]
MWYLLNKPEEVISPSLLFYKDRIENNIRSMVHIAGDVNRLVPHVKTHKTAEIVKLQLNAGITKFKCATIAEAEMLADSGAKWILLAYQMVGPNISRLFALRKKYADVTFSSLIDNEQTAQILNDFSETQDFISTIFIDVNNGMNRSGHTTDGTILSLYRFLSTLPNIEVSGVHVYDGHIRNAEFSERKAASDEAFELVYPLFDLIKEATEKEPMIIVGGSPSFTVHTLRPDVFLSPGTNVLWDWGYGDLFDDQPFLHAALILTRVVSKPSVGIITIDLGHKAVAAENPIDKRFRLLNLNGYTVTGQSEEHGVLEIGEEAWETIQIGDVYYALPYHICPSVALHDYASVIENGDVIDEWKIVARNRRITI